MITNLLLTLLITNPHFVTSVEVWKAIFYVQPNNYSDQVKDLSLSDLHRNSYYFYQDLMSYRYSNHRNIPLNHHGPYLICLNCLCFLLNYHCCFREISFDDP